ncbi:GDSL-type esterase/lipase family protein [Nocardia alni]|uniref:GDSL-type esterase/lipase family protein n=1 Tax=Nocardia alni TaxID=2815723 RepID=UPI0020B253F7|nr:GDSL-type esterase/lipase family protein [Nocardia alni]
MGSGNVIGDMIGGRRRAVRRRSRCTGVVVAVGALIAGAVAASPPGMAESGSCGTHFVASWLASPTDAISPVDASGGPIPLTVDDQTFRMVISPHLGGSEVRIHLTNRFGLTPVTFGQVNVGVQTAAAAVRDPQPVRFGGKTSITVPAGGDMISDPVALRFNAFTPLAVSIYVPGSAGPPTKHWNANATSYYSPPRSGDLTGRTDGRGFGATTGSWLYLSGLDVAASGPQRAIVAFGDSITDGFVSSTPLSVPADRAVADTNGRYPDRLQHILDRAGIPISVVNAGIGSNRLLASGEPLMLGPSALERFDHDALNQAGVAGVLLQEGINDLGLLPRPDADQMIAGYRQLIARAHARGIKIWLGTLLPASNAIVDGRALAPNSEATRQRINSWIRTQHDADGVVDFDAALRDPADPAVLQAADSSVDHLHPGPHGYQAMADAVDPSMLTTTTENSCHPS